MNNHNRLLTKIVRIFCVVFGSMLMAVSLYGMLHGIFWVPRFNYKYGEQGVASLAGELLFGALLFCLGAFMRDGEEEERSRRGRKEVA